MKTNKPKSMNQGDNSKLGGAFPKYCTEYYSQSSAEESSQSDMLHELKFPMKQ